MKTLVVIDSDQAFDLVSFYLKPLGFEILRYRHPIKAMDNLDEIDPDAVLISAADFPRQWKPLVQFIRTDRDKKRTSIILLKGSQFSYEDAAKATYLGVNGIASDDLNDKEELDRVQEILARYAPVKNGRTSRRFRPAQWDRFGFALSEPRSLAVVPGQVLSISASGLAFSPDDKSALAGLEPGTIIEDCSLRVDDTLMSVDCSLVRLEPVPAFNFEKMNPDDKTLLDDYLHSRALRELHSKK